MGEIRSRNVSLLSVIQGLQGLFLQPIAQTQFHTDLFSPYNGVIIQPMDLCVYIYIYKIIFFLTERNQNNQNKTLQQLHTYVRVNFNTAQHYFFSPFVWIVFLEKAVISLLGC